jgi:hypothetical protein
MFGFLKKKTIQSQLPVGTEIIVRSAEGSSFDTYDSIVYGYEDERILIKMPVDGVKPMGVYRTLPISVLAMLGADKLAFVSKIVGIVKEPSLLKLAMPVEWRIGTQRKHFRIHIRMSVSVFVGDTKALNVFKSNRSAVPLANAAMSDISGGGCSLSVEADVHAGE